MTSDTPAASAGLPRVHVLPGMGADHMMYAAAPWRRLTEARFLDWPVHRGETSIEAMAGRVIAEADIREGDTVIGSSLGGIVGCEIARRVRVQNLVLIGSAVRREEISALLTWLHPLADLAPIEFVQRAAGRYPSELTQMFSRSQASFVRAMCRAIFDWPGLSESVITPVRLHGKHDRVILPPRQANLLLDGGHLLAMSHAEECVRFLEKPLAAM